MAADLLYIWQCVYVCMFVCMFAIGARTVRPRDEIWHGGGVPPWERQRLGLIWTGLKVLLEVRPAQTICFPENFIKAKLKHAPSLVGAGQVRTSLRGAAASP